ncbi:MAG: hypothetical protein O7A65_06435 [Proteobacteria bacterium]|nr:hypothetical protein [Pseudomonadota bacterium]
MLVPLRPFATLAVVFLLLLVGDARIAWSEDSPVAQRHDDWIVKCDRREEVDLFSCGVANQELFDSGAGYLGVAYTNYDWEKPIFFFIIQGSRFVSSKDVSLRVDDGDVFHVETDINELLNLSVFLQEGGDGVSFEKHSAFLSLIVAMALSGENDPSDIDMNKILEVLESVGTDQGVMFGGGLSPPIIEAMEAGEAMHVEFAHGEDEELEERLVFSLAGFGNALATLQEILRELEGD